MRQKRAILIISILIVAGAAIYGIVVSAVHAQGAGDRSETTFSEKLGTILQNQKSIMEDLASIKEDLRIIKVRVTQSQ